MWTHRRGSPAGNQTLESHARRKRADAAHARQVGLDGGGEAVLDEPAARGAHDPTVAERVAAANREIADCRGFRASFSRAFATVTRRAAGAHQSESTGRALEGPPRRRLPHRPRWLGPAPDADGGSLRRLIAMLRLPSATIRSMTAAAHDDGGARRQRAEDAGHRHDRLAAGHDSDAAAGLARGDSALDRLHRYQARIQREAARLARQHAATTAAGRVAAEHEPTEVSDEAAQSGERHSRRSRREPAA